MAETIDLTYPILNKVWARKDKAYLSITNKVRIC